ncbi:ABC transporter permease [Chitinophaga defluvii]|uniref:ABC transporter permease n=1 Tax=Chitinophaga defluvii TaxID=3163343 RepID=A0ABV2TGX6_9BACT
MFRNYLKIAIRGLLKNKRISFINIFGLSVGMAVTILIGLWIWDELSFNKYHENYPRIARVWQRFSMKGETGAFPGLPIPVAAELRNKFPDDFKYVVIASSPGTNTISFQEKKFTQSGSFMEEDGPEMLTLKMLKGTRNGLKDPSSIMLSATLAKSLFGDTDPLNKIVKLDNRLNVKVTGVYEDLPRNTYFNELTFVAPWKLYTTSWDWIHAALDRWDVNVTSVFVQLAPQADFDKVSQKIGEILEKKNPSPPGGTTSIFLHPMSRWHLYAEFKNGVSVGGQIQYVRLFGIIGFFVLLLACINFMNLSTARSEKRAKEVGIRKAVGSVRGQLISQFLSESILVSLFSFWLSLVIVQLLLPWFNQVADKDISVLWRNPWFWTAGIGFSLFTGLLAGSYPALYLSAFQPVKVLKGTFRAGRFAALPRKVLVVVQFSVSVLLITGTIIVFKQIQYAKNRPVGYTREGLIAVRMTTPDIYNNYQAARTALLETGMVGEVSESQGPVTDIWSSNGGFEWEGKMPGEPAFFATIGITFEHGKTVGWQFVDGRDFSRNFATDSAGVVLNESAVKYMKLENPVGKIIRWDGVGYKVLGVIKDMIMASPYEPIPQSFFYILKERGNFINVRIKPDVNIRDALTKISAIFQQYNPAAPFEYSFADEEYAKKFNYEVGIGKLSTFFATLAILISCLGLFGLASFVAEQRTKEIGIRKVLGASAFNLWRMLSKDFVLLVLLSCCIAIPFAWYFLHDWLQRYAYHTEITWWIFAIVAGGVLLIALLTVSYQATRAALANPVKSLRSE